MKLSSQLPPSLHLSITKAEAGGFYTSKGGEEQDNSQHKKNECRKFTFIESIYLEDNNTEHSSDVYHYILLPTIKHTLPDIGLCLLFCSFRIVNDRR
jgi:hypothetical protein